MMMEPLILIIGVNNRPMVSYGRPWFHNVVSCFQFNPWNSHGVILRCVLGVWDHGIVITIETKPKGLCNSDCNAVKGS